MQLCCVDQLLAMQTFIHRALQGTYAKAAMDTSRALYDDAHLRHISWDIRKLHADSCAG